MRLTVDYARQKGLYVIIDWHYIGNTNDHRSTTSAFWTDMAPRFANDSHVFFELFNEPVNAGDWSSVRTDMQTWYDIVRARDCVVRTLDLGTPHVRDELRAPRRRGPDGRIRQGLALRKARRGSPRALTPSSGPRRGTLGCCSDAWEAF
jgi:aryl-phospho-beta-D-glucosidase BglC (GH1 family)